jgi:Asp-tRNA(Asn)/Glu-tRNA(Gln) amidotransferase A subunit family amidase
MVFSSLGDWLGLLATTAMAQQLSGGSYATANFAIAGVFIARLLPAVFLGPIARIIAIARENGAVIAGKTKTSEFAVHKETDVINPRFPGYTAGTSSAGSAAAVANGTIDLAFSTQTAGSIARPASYCGVVGFKPTFGDWPCTGVLKTTDDFDTVGIMGRHTTLIKDFYVATRLSGADYPVLENRRQRNEFKKVVMLVGEANDSSTEEIANLAQSFYETRVLPFGFRRINQEEYLFFANIRKAYEIIYRHELMYYFKKEIDLKSVSQELMNFIDMENVPNEREYLEAKSTLNAWKVECQKMFQKPLIVTLSASTSAPVSDVAYQKDLNAAITAAGFPQLSIPAFSDSEGKNISISLSGIKGTDVEILDLGTRILSKTDSQLTEG